MLEKRAGRGQTCTIELIKLPLLAAAGSVLNAGSDSAGLGQGLRPCLSHRLPVVQMLLIRDHTFSAELCLGFSCGVSFWECWVLSMEGT